MIQLGRCLRCKGFLGIAVKACPHCGMALGRARKIVAGLTGLAGGGAVSVTLMACYGGPCVDDDCSGYGESDAGRTAADARVNLTDAPDDARRDASADARRDASADASSDAPVDALLEASRDASLDAPDGD